MCFCGLSSSEGALTSVCVCGQGENLCFICQHLFEGTVIHDNVLLTCTVLLVSKANKSDTGVASIKRAF